MVDIGVRADVSMLRVKGVYLSLFNIKKSEVTLVFKSVLALFSPLDL